LPPAHFSGGFSEFKLSFAEFVSELVFRNSREGAEVAAIAISFVLFASSRNALWFSCCLTKDGCGRTNVVVTSKSS
jgi:hypothetical protein